MNDIYSNTATVIGTVPAQPAPTLPGFPAPQPEQITKTDPSHYEVVMPAIALTKYTNGEDADTVTGPQVQAFGLVTWTYLVTNTGNVTLTIAAGQLVDDKEGPINTSAFTLAPGASTWLTQTGTAQVGQYTNTGVVTGTPSLPQGTPDLPGFPTPAITQPVTATNPSHYIGLVSSLGNFVWEDLNHDGIQDANEPGIAGVTVTLQTPTGTLTTFTDANGYYAFTNLLSGVLYTVSFTAPANYTFTLQTQGGDATADSNVNPFTGVAQAVVLGLGENNSTIDAGLWRPMSLGNRVWQDFNNDGVDANEPGVAGVTMTLYLNGVAISMTTTDANGFYTFTGLISGTYSVTAQLPAGYVSSTPDEVDPNADVNNNDNGIGSSGGIVTSGLITMFPGSEPTSDGDSDSNTNYTIDFGAWQPMSLGNRVFEDLNNDGIDANATGIAGVTMTLYLNGVATARR